MPSRSPARQDKEPALIFSPDSIRGRISASGWFRGLRGGWTERKTEREEEEEEDERGGWGRQELGRRPQLTPLAFLARGSLSRAFFWYRLCWKLVARSENGADREISL